MLSGEIGLALVAIAGALILARLWRAAEGRVAALQSKTEALVAEGKELGASLSKQTQARKKQAEELTALRNKTDKVKRRQSRAVDQPLGTTARIRDHEAQVERVELERDRANTERDGLALQVARLEKQLEASARALAEASEPRPMPIASELETALEQAQAELAASREELTKRTEELGIARGTEARMRKRMSNQEQLYASLRAELDVKKDRLRTQEEQLQRLQALKVAVID
jgi:DNA repair exonuclease SbcCD ATPase subunit